VPCKNRKKEKRNQQAWDRKFETVPLAPEHNSITSRKQGVIYSLSDCPAGYLIRTNWGKNKL